MSEETNATPESKLPPIVTDFIEHQKNALSEMTKALEGIVPPATREHGQAAINEVLEGYRGLLNTAVDNVMNLIERLKSDEKPE